MVALKIQDWRATDEPNLTGFDGPENAGREIDGANEEICRDIRCM